MTAAGPRHAAARALIAHPWACAVGVAGVLIAVLRLSDLSGSPPGLYSDEASIGYNAWAIAHHGVDEWGNAFPLYFRAFGEYKNPVYVYAVAALARVLPLSVTVERLPAALFGICVCAFAALTAWRLTSSRAVTLLTLMTAGLMPWLVLQARVGFEVVSMIACLVIALWCLAMAQRGSPRWYALAGIAMGLAVFAYSTGRLLVGLLAVALAACYGFPRRRSHARWSLALLGVIVAYALLAWWISRHPGALSAEFGSISITAGHASLATLVARFAGNYVTYFSFPFLATHGDANLRHSTGFGGMLMVTSLPAIVTGLVLCVRRWGEPLCRFAVIGLVVAPVPAALTQDGTPHALRAAAMIPFLLLLAAIGWEALWPRLVHHRAWVVALAAAACLESGSFLYDLYTQYPGRSLTAFDSGEAPAIERASEIAHGREVLLSSTLDVPYVQALFALQPSPQAYLRMAPGSTSSAQHITAALAALHMVEVPAANMETRARPGDVLVLAGTDTPPANTTALFTESVTVTAPNAYPGLEHHRVVLVRVVRR